MEFFLPMKGSMIQTTIVFDQNGDYIFEIIGIDLADHMAVVDYSGGAENAFRIDMTNIRFTNENGMEIQTMEDMTISGNIVTLDDSYFHDDGIYELRTCPHRTKIYVKVYEDEK